MPGRAVGPPRPPRPAAAAAGRRRRDDRRRPRPHPQRRRRRPGPATGRAGPAPPGPLYFRATNSLAQAERMLAHADPGRLPTYRRLLTLTEKAFELHSPRVRRVEIPYEGTTLPAYFSAAPSDGPAPVIVLVNGLDS